MLSEVKTTLLEKLCQFSPKNLYAVTDAQLPATSEFISIGSPDQKPLDLTYANRRLLIMLNSKKMKKAAIFSSTSMQSS